MSRWFEVAARRYRFGTEPPAYIGRQDGIVSRVDELKKVGLVVTTSEQTVNGGGFIVTERMLAWPKASDVERELATTTMVGRRKLQGAIAVDLKHRLLALVHEECTLDAKLVHLATARECLVPLDVVYAVEDFAMWPSGTTRKFSSGNKLDVVALLRTSSGGREWPGDIPLVVNVGPKLRQQVLSALGRRYK